MEPTFKSHSVITTDGQTISFDYYQNGFDHVVILAHGFYNSKQAVLFRDMAHDFSRRFDVIVMDFRGHGKSSGSFTWTAKEYLDIEAILNFTADKYRRVGLIGFSLGAAASLIAVSRTDRISSLIAVSPPTSFRLVDFRLFQMGFKENVVYNLFQEGRIGKGVRPGSLWMKKIRPLDIVDQIQTPTLFVHGAKDWLILPWHTLQLYDKAKCYKELKIFPDGTHAEYIYRKYRAEFTDYLIGWFEKTLDMSSTGGEGESKE